MNIIDLLTLPYNDTVEPSLLQIFIFLAEAVAVILLVVGLLILNYEIRKLDESHYRDIEGFANRFDEVDKLILKYTEKGYLRGFEHSRIERLFKKCQKNNNVKEANARIRNRLNHLKNQIGE